MSFLRSLVARRLRPVPLLESSTISINRIGPVRIGSGTGNAALDDDDGDSDSDGNDSFSLMGQSCTISLPTSGRTEIGAILDKTCDMFDDADDVVDDDDEDDGVVVLVASSSTSIWPRVSAS